MWTVSHQRPWQDRERHSLMHHDHLNGIKGEPPARARLQNQLNDLAGIEISTQEFWIGFILFQSHDAEMMLLHDRDYGRGQ